MILYFSGTGNSRHVAQAIAAKTGDQLLSLNHCLKTQQQTIPVGPEPLVIVCPVYAWRIPRLVDAYLRSAVCAEQQRVYFVLTCGSDSANALHHLKKLCQRKNWQLQGFAEIVMPENYTAMFECPDEQTAQQVLAAAAPIIAEIAADIQAGRHFSRGGSNSLATKLKSGIVNSLFYALIVKAKGFHVCAQSCNSCGKCATLCPLNNIRLSDGQPRWGKDCTHCMACINACPQQAIEYKQVSQGKPRYFLAD